MNQDQEKFIQQQKPMKNQGNGLLGWIACPLWAGSFRFAKRIGEYRRGHSHATHLPAGRQGVSAWSSIERRAQRDRRQQRFLESEGQSLRASRIDIKRFIPNRYVFMRGIKAVFIHWGLILVTLTCLFPLFWMIRSSLMTNATVFVDKSLIPSRLHFENYYLAWTQGNFGIYFLNSLFYTAAVVIGIVLISSLAAYAFSRLNFPGKNLFFYMFVAAMMIPLPGSFVPLYVMMNKLGLVNTRHGYILCMINVGLPLSILLLKTFFDKMPPDLEDAARIDGCSKLGIWRHVALPLARPAIAVIVIFNSLNVWNEYILATLLLNDKALMPLQRGVMVFQGAHSVDYPLLMSGLTIAAAPIIIIYLFMQKHIIKGLTSGAVVG